MPEEQLFKTEEARPRPEIADVLTTAAEQIEDGTVVLGGGSETREVDVPETPRFEVELERLTDSETGEQRYELEYEIRWTE
ncbi:amphi-Trp domain-containing protein [Halolamina salina]|uniref:Amphi-Trp domain-containing protein n=1 Tax=Halolamina salina TaxID=1220023 RepID=A0ABD6B616_9EURY